ncbi:hypothetical protein J4E93_002961 [Alternaria ventricosa]|uniref:uncharacterized protein n=1 Tax=Alternaria ventricosa TaxID=1187951 RepID=UPI0020C41283|nr:uncharacterized protein J4E93_002961 [Alternaria ventricosa]KAI4650604.1 hypothetical protein J4E93_002961 [Alternaria ventricosa]
MPPKTNEEAYEAASDLFDVDPEQAIAAAKLNLQVGYISWYWIIENALLIACAEGEWREAEYWRLFAEDMYSKAMFKARYQNDPALIEVLAVVREELDEVKEKLIDSLTGMTDEERAEMARTDEDNAKSEDEDEDETEEKPVNPLLGMIDLERDEVVENDNGEEKAQEKEVAEENEEKAEIGAVVHEHKDTLKPPRALPLRSKRGAANAHEFTKSLGRSSGKTPLA